MHRHSSHLTENSSTNILACLAAETLFRVQTNAKIENIITSCREHGYSELSINKKPIAASHIYQYLLDADVERQVSDFC